MEDLVALLHDLRRDGVQLWVENDKLRVRGANTLSERRRSELREAQNALVAHLRRETVTADTGRTVHPLSFAQRALYYLDRFDGAGAAYNMVFAVRLSGALDLAALRGALLDLEARHEILRTHYPSDAAGPVQQVRPPGDLDLAIVDGRGWSEPRLEAFVQQETGRPFDLAAAPPVRCRVLRCGEGDNLLVLVVHHIAADGPSLSRLCDDLEQDYAARRTGGARGGVPVSHGDFARWQRLRAEDGAFESDLAYWTQQLAGAPDMLDLPVDRRSPDAAGPESGGAVEFRWPRDLSGRVLAAARAQGLTPFMALLGAFQLLLARWSGQTDICVGAPMAARPSQFEDQVGNFLNTLVMRARIDPRQAAGDFLRTVRETALAGYAHSAAPFDLVVARLRPDRRPGVNPLFQCLFTLDDVAQAPFRLGDVDGERVWPELRTAKFPLTLLLSVEGDEISGAFEYATTLFDRETIEDLSACLPVLAEALLTGERRPLGVLPLLPEALRRRILVDRNHTGLPLGSPRTLDAWCADQAREHGDRVAVAGDGERLTYAELDAAADAIARCLAASGAGPEAIVGVCLPRRPMLIAALLGILKAGAAYLPLDPAYPAERLRFMIDDSRCKLVVTLKAWGDRFDQDGLVVCAVDALAAETTPVPITPTGPDNLAYVIYTSGSTGTPKGVALTHGNATAFLRWAETAFREEARGMLATTSICFDLSVFEIFLPLVTGGTIHLLDSASTLAEGPPPAGAGLLNTVPSAAAVLCDVGRLPTSLTTINLAGEALQRSLVERLHVAVPSLRLCNLYGPSEYTTYATWCEVESDSDAPVDIGRPIANTRIYILDSFGQPVPDGAPGEIFIGGVGLARGYARRPALTAQRFLPDPFGPPGGRLYATGDFGRYRRDGRIHYLGRLDQQVKIRGYRIELGEIEARLRACEGVRDAAVVVFHAPAGPELMAHVVVRDADAADPEALRSSLLRSLPGHMAPSGWRFHDALPLNSNGKVDRAALAAAASSVGPPQARYAAPRDAAESFLAETWRDVLRVERVGIDDNFFELGGHSLLATAIVARLADQHFPQLGLRDIFSAPTVRQLTARLAATEGARDEPIPAADRSERPPASFTQQRMWFLDQLEPQQSVYNVCVAWRLSGELDVDVLRRCLREIRARHEILRTVFRADAEGRPVQAPGADGEMPLPLLDLADEADPDAAAEVWLRADAEAPFDLAEGPLFRAAVLRLSPDEHILQVGMPHIIADGWSFDVILSELGVLYPALRKGLPSPLPPLPIQFADYAAWERGRLEGEVLETPLAFFRTLLAGAPPRLELPFDRPRPAVASYCGDVHAFAFDPALSEQLRQVARRRQVSLFMLMSAIFDVLLHRMSGQADFCIGYSVGNRFRPQTQPLIGPFVNTLVRRVRIDGAQPFDAHLAAVCKQMLDADEHQDLPFEKLVEELSPQRDLAHHPIFQVTYSFSTTHGPRTRKTRTLRGVGEEEVSLPGLELSLVEPGYQTAKFDLALFVSETGEEIEGDLEFTVDLFEPETIRRLSRQFERLCRSVVANPAAALCELDIVPDEERQVLLDLSPRTPSLVEPDPVVAFLRAAELTPGADAVAFNGDRRSYAELAGAAGGLAGQLRATGISAGALVGLRLPPGFDLAVGMLAVLATGAAFVVLDPEVVAPPAPPLAALVVASDDAAVEAGSLPIFVCGAGAHGPLEAAVADPEAPACCASAENAETVGWVSISRRALAARIAGLRAGFLKTTDGPVAIAAPIGGELIVVALLGALAIGVCVEFPAPAVSDATLLIATPGRLRPLLAAGLRLPRLVTAGLTPAPIDKALALALGEVAPQAGLAPFYGCAAGASFAGAQEGPGPVWRRAAGVRIYVLDSLRRLVPVGFPGRLWMAGEGLASGYVGAPLRTAARFAPDPFGEPGGRMWMTDHIARVRADGCIEVLGNAEAEARLDQAAAARARAEAALRGLPGVADAALCVLQDGVVAGFVAPHPGVELAPAVLRDRLFTELPRHIAPAEIWVLAALPRDAGGGVNRAALRDQATPRAARVRRPPATPSERGLAAIWRDLLQREEIWAEHSFFALGGHSLSAIRLVHRVDQDLGVRLPLRAVFEFPLLSDLARRIDGIAADAATLPAIEAPIRVLPRPATWRGVVEPAGPE